jgi:hypothetical protein
MKRFILTLYVVAIGIVLASTLFISQPSTATAGGFPCFLCHGVNFEGSDIAPAVAGTKLTDAQITKQMRNPRGVMPSFGLSDWPDPQTAITYIRAQPTGKPTMALSPRDKSAALATISAGAAARATAVLQTPGVNSAVDAATTTPPPTATLAPGSTPRPSVPATTANTPASPISADSSRSFVMLLGALLVVGVGFVWIRQRR